MFLQFEGVPKGRRIILMMSISLLTQEHPRHRMYGLPQADVNPTGHPDLRLLSG